MNSWAAPEMFKTGPPGAISVAVFINTPDTGFFFNFTDDTQTDTQFFTQFRKMCTVPGRRGEQQFIIITAGQLEIPNLRRREFRESVGLRQFFKLDFCPAPRRFEHVTEVCQQTIKGMAWSGPIWPLLQYCLMAAALICPKRRS